MTNTKTRDQVIQPSITRAQIVALSAEAESAGDQDQVALCDAALRGEAAAVEACAEVIVDALCNGGKDSL